MSRELWTKGTIRWVARLASNLLQRLEEEGLRGWRLAGNVAFLSGGVRGQGEADAW